MGVAGSMFSTKEHAMRFAKQLVVLVGLMMWRCAAEPIPSEVVEGEPMPPKRPEEMGGNAQESVVPRFVHLPFAKGKSAQCVQGVNGEFSHQGRSTKFDVDFDTSNVTDDAVFAQIAGRA